MSLAPLIFACVWCALHFGAYLALRRAGRLGAEHSIFWFHLLPFGVFSVGTFVIWALTDMGFSTALGAIAILCIYSLSFLEAWSLSEGSYSLSILNAIRRKEIVTADQAIAELSRIGEQKKRDRLIALQRLGLLKGDEAGFVLTEAGIRAAAALKLIRWLVNYRDND